MKRMALAFVGLVVIVLLLRHRQDQSPMAGRRIALGTLVSVKLYSGSHLDVGLIDTAFAVIARTDSVMTRFSESSEANRLARAAVGTAFVCSPDMAVLLGRCQYYARRTRGRFDVTIGALTRLWNFPEATAPPDPARIDSARALVGYKSLVVDGRRVRLLRPGIRLDLGAAAKGYAVDKAVERLQDLGVTAGLIEAGGDIRFWGAKPDSTAWRFGIQHPRDSGRYATVGDIGLPAIATSGDYEQFFQYDGRRYHHILDPVTGYPATASVSATAWAVSALEADILSTALFILGPEDGLRFAEQLPHVEALIYYLQDGQLKHCGTSGVSDRVHFSDDDN